MRQTGAACWPTCCSALLRSPPIWAPIPTSAAWSAVTPIALPTVASAWTGLSTACNSGPHHLHGGPAGLHQVVWQAEPTSGPDGPGLRLRYHSPAGEGGYPGALALSVSYTLHDSGALRIDYVATTDRPTPINLTSHGYFNLAGGGDVLGHELYLAADYFLPVDATLIPTGERRAVAGTPLDFTTPTPIGARLGADDEQLRYAGGYDHCFVLRRVGELPVLAARVVEPQSGRVLELYTTQPGVQLYTGNALDGSLRGKGGQHYTRYAGLCLEAQHFPDAPNQPDFPSTILRPGETYRHTTIYRLFSIATWRRTPHPRSR